MIFDIKKRFIFVHNPRTAGTSIRKVLNARNNLDIETEISKKVKGTFFDQSVEWAHPDHCNIQFAKTFLDVKIEDYKYIFTCVRNPYDRTFSYWKNILNARNDFIQKHPEAIDGNLLQTSGTAEGAPPWWQSAMCFEEWIKYIYDVHKSSNADHFKELPTYPYKFWTENVDEVIKFENLTNQTTWDRLMECCEINEDGQTIPFGHANASKASDIHYSQAYNNSMKKMVSEIFYEDINRYEYTFESK